MGLKALIGVVLALIIISPAQAQRTRFDGIRQCERHAGMQFRRHDPQFRRFFIYRSGVTTKRLAERVGSQFITTVYHGQALYEAAGGAQIVRFICLHAGIVRGPVFVYAFAD